MIGYLSIESTVQTLSAPSWDMKAGTRGCKLHELQVNNRAANIASSNELKFGRSPTTATQTSPVLVRASNPGDGAFETGCAVAWSVAPTEPLLTIRHFAFAAASGQSWAWMFPRGIKFLANESFVLWNPTRNSLMPTNFAVEVGIDE